MNFSLMPIYVIIVFAFCILITYRAKKNRFITAGGARSIYILLLVLFFWTLLVIVLGIHGIHLLLMNRIPLLWQTIVPTVILGIALLISRTLRNALSAIASTTPWHWLTFFQALRISALGGIIKAFKGEITSNFFYWVGVPDFLFGLSALVMGWLVLKKAVNTYFLMIWSLIGAAIILVPVYMFMNYFMKQPGFNFIFQFPMILAPSIVVPLFVYLNLLLAWGTFNVSRKASR